MLPVGHYQVPPPLRPLLSGNGGGWQSTGASLWVYMPGNHGTRVGCKPLCDQPSFRTDFSSVPSKPEHPNDPVGPSSAMHGLGKVLSLGESWRLAWHQRSSCSMPFEYAVDGNTSQTHTGSNSTLLNALTGKCKHLMPITHRGWTSIVRTIRKTFEKICKYWFKVVTVSRLIWGNDHLYCVFGDRRSHLTLHWMSAQGSVGFRWGTITGPYHANCSQVETQKFDPHWFYCLQWGCNNPFCQESTHTHTYIYIYNAVNIYIEREITDIKWKVICDV